MNGGTNRADDGDDPLIGRVFNDRFQIVQRIGRGGVGAVYLAIQAPFDRPCALKVLRPRYQEDGSHEFHRRFFLEASTAAKLHHPNNVAVFDYGHTEDGMYFMAMEYLEGRTLQQAIRQDGAFDEERTAHIGRQICRALREAHHHGVIHRDIKPSNVFLLDRHDENDVVKVLDFGLVKDVSDEDGEDLTKAGQFMGSPKYMSPEQIHGSAVDARTDIYSLGVVMYEMVTGRVPFDGGATFKTLIAHIQEDVPPLRSTNPACDVPLWLEQTIYRCIAKNPADRFSSMDELLAVLKQTTAGALTATLVSESGRQFIDSGPIALSGSAPQPTTVTAPPDDTGRTMASRPSSARHRSSWTRRHGKTVIGAAAVLGAVMATLFMMGRRDQTRAVDSTIHSVSPAAEIPPAPPSVARAVVSAPVADDSTKVEPERVLVLSMSPENARVRLLDGTLLCDGTPCLIPASRLEQGELTVQVTAPGYYSAKRKLVTDDEKVSVQLTQIPARTNATPVVPTGYKENPFGEMPPY